MIRGFSLVETVIVVALSVVMLLTLGFLVYSFNESVSYQQAIAQSSGSADMLMREAGSLVLPADAVLQTHTFSSSTHTSSSTTLVIEIPSIDSSGMVIANTYDYATFYTEGPDAYRLLEANTLSRRVSGTKLLSSTVSALTFSYDAADFTQVDTVTIDLQTQAQVKQHPLSDHRQEQLRLRNH
ncbi:MAG: hypothetical protein WC798_01615 [Candidatus Paceibacterota bacterium]|jgi:hypothetical protein